MPWYNSKLASSFLAILTGSGDGGLSAGGDDSVPLEEIREAMLELAHTDQSDPGLKVVRRIRYAIDVQTLWFLRGEVMGLLARTRGEAAAREEIDRISDLFADLLPQGLRSRPSPLSGNQRGRVGSGGP